MSKKVMIEVDEDAMKELDEFIGFFYYHRKRQKQMLESGQYDEWDVEQLYGNFVYDYQYFSYRAKKLAKSFGLYPYNQEEILFPDIIHP